jgi:hypothetical protein
MKAPAVLHALLMTVVLALALAPRLIPKRAANLQQKPRVWLLRRPLQLRRRCTRCC